MPILGSQLELYSQLFNGDNERNLLLHSPPRRSITEEALGFRSLEFPWSHKAKVEREPCWISHWPSPQYLTTLCL